jgi:hypothetical protein
MRTFKFIARKNRNSLITVANVPARSEFGSDGMRASPGAKSTVPSFKAVFSKSNPGKFRSPPVWKGWLMGEANA